MIRGFFVALLDIFLFLALFTMAISWDLSSSLKYENIQNQIVNISPVINQQFNISQELNDKLPTIKNYCINNPDYVFSYQNYALHFSCQDINKTEIIIVEDTIKNFVSDLYYKTYNCSYWNCLNQYSAPFLVSEKSDIYWQNILYISLIISVLITTLLFFLFKKKQDLPFIVGSLVIITSLPLLGISQILSHFPDATIASVTSLFFSQSSYVFIRMVIIGIFILLIGLVIELFRAGFKIYDMFSRPEEANTTIKDSNIKNKKK